MFCSSRRRLRATVVFPFSVFSSSMDRLSPVTSHDLISSWTTERRSKRRLSTAVFHAVWVAATHSTTRLEIKVCMKPSLATSATAVAGIFDKSLHNIHNRDVTQKTITTMFPLEQIKNVICVTQLTTVHWCTVAIHTAPCVSSPLWDCCSPPQI